MILSVEGAWYCNITKRIFVVSSSAKWKKIGIIITGSTAQFDFPDIGKDPSYKPFIRLLNSFKSKVDKIAYRVRKPCYIKSG
jgi:hypothetical protein